MSVKWTEEQQKVTATFSYLQQQVPERQRYLLNGLFPG